jgi:hypothetical protein
MGNSSTISWRRSAISSAVRVKVLPQLATKAVAATGTEYQPVVAGALAIADLTAVFAEGFAMTQADFLPQRIGQRFGGDDQALYRQLVLAEGRQRGGIAFHRRHQPAP